MLNFNFDPKLLKGEINPLKCPNHKIELKPVHSDSSKDSKIYFECSIGKEQFQVILREWSAITRAKHEHILPKLKINPLKCYRHNQILIDAPRLTPTPFALLVCQKCPQNNRLYDVILREIRQKKTKKVLISI